MIRMATGDPITVRILGGICFVGAILAVISTLIHPRIQGSRNLVLILAMGIYFVVASIGTILLRKITALMLVTPLALMGAASVAVSILEGPPVALILNLLLSAPLLCIPAFVIYRNWRCLR